MKYEYTQIVWWLVIGMALNITGSSFWPLNTIYMKQELKEKV